MAAGKVDTLLMLDANPVYTAPADLDFAAALRHVPLSVSLALYADETALASTWRIPATHEYEAWSDARAFDGTITIQQPQVRRLYGGHSAHELLAVLQGDTHARRLRPAARLLAAPRAAARTRRFRAFLARLAARRRRREQRRDRGHGHAARRSRGRACRLPPASRRAGLDVLFRPDELVRDGRFADNPWLLEMPRPFTRLTWDNAALIAPATATRLGARHRGRRRRSTSQGRQVRAPVFVLPGQAPDCITLPLGFGRVGGRARRRRRFRRLQAARRDRPLARAAAASPRPATR